jgi:exopolysaccharide biosynthesis polyprenyl glycosylphosphotransferase
MIQQRTKIFRWTLLFGDLFATFLAFGVAYLLRDAFPQERYSILFPFSWYLSLLPLIFPIWAIVFYASGLYRFWKGPSFWQEIWALSKALLIASLVLGFGVFALKFVFVSRIFLLIFFTVNFLFIISIRLGIRKLILLLNKKIETFRRILIVGTKDRARSFARNIEKHQDLGLRIMGFLATEEKTDSAHINGFPVLGKAQDLPQVLEREVVDEVVFAIAHEELKGMENLFLLCEERGITARVVMNFFPHNIAKTHLEELDGIPLLTFRTTPKNELVLLLRRIFDFCVSLALILLLSPLFLLIAILIRLDSPGPAIFRQTRCGLNGRKFTFYKFRSMVQDAEKKQAELVKFNIMQGPVFKMKNDPRITRIGYYLRKTSLDELPQLFNVLSGDMSLVGPRPPIPEEVENYEGWQRRRLSMKPGITGLWQVNGRNTINFDEWMKMDLEYIDNWSIWLDLKILLKTIPVVLFGKGAM